MRPLDDDDDVDRSLTVPWLCDGVVDGVEMSTLRVRLAQGWLNGRFCVDQRAAGMMNRRGWKCPKQCESAWIPSPRERPRHAPYLQDASHAKTKTCSLLRTQTEKTKTGKQPECRGNVAVHTTEAEYVDEDDFWIC